MLRSRVSKTPDVGRISKAVERPGIDPRVWVAIGFVVKVVVDDEGPLVDVVLQDGTEDTVRQGATYAGPGYGFYEPLYPDDEVVIKYPMGEWDHGGVISARCWSKSDAPPQQAKDTPEDVCLVVKKDKNLRMIMQGGGNLVLKVATGKVLLGDESGTSPSARKGDKCDGGKLLFNPGSGGATLAYIPPGGPVPPGPPPIGTIELDLVPVINEGSKKVESA